MAKQRRRSDREDQTKLQTAEGIPLFTRDEMNLVELPFGPISPPAENTMDVTHLVWDPELKREVTRQTTIIGSDKYGLPRPIDDQVLVGMSALTYEAQYASRQVEFSRYELCRILNWAPDGRSYRRLDESFYRIAGTTLQFKDAWWDKGESEWKSKTFHLIDELNLCSRDQLQRSRLRTGEKRQRLCSFEWSKTIFKSFEDGFIKSLDMEMFRRIANGRRRDVPVRLFRILDKRFYKTRIVRMKVDSIGVGIIGLSPNYSPSQLIRILERAGNCLIDCGYLRKIRFEDSRGRWYVTFEKAVKRRSSAKPSAVNVVQSEDCRLGGEPNPHTAWVQKQPTELLIRLENAALAASFGSELERERVHCCRKDNEPIADSGIMRHQYIQRYAERITKSATRTQSVAS
ncbi:Replication initiator protein A [Crateriforma conspicua]|uniref:Replication initiator protein A n=1 Tax=Crateriforma conspicua TaxID=2527996 RepID=A0A5C6FPL7_9PLAN|nr:plasmid replication initiator TrfA [Crateriforma conspicua]TWU62353.1 Replication initiator protein A [Crateriforma conspicua]